jgi:hypothetical protein
MITMIKIQANVHEHRVGKNKRAREHDSDDYKLLPRSLARSLACTQSPTNPPSCVVILGVHAESAASHHLGQMLCSR